MTHTAKVYYDIDGNPTTLYRMVRDEPDWAMGRIQAGEEALDRAAELKMQVNRLSDLLRVPVTAYGQFLQKEAITAEALDSWFPRAMLALDEAPSMGDADQIALDTARSIAAIDPEALLGGDVQALARAQILIRDAMRRYVGE